MSTCMHVCMHVCMVCMYVCIYIDDDVFYILLLLVKICGMVHFGAPTMFAVSFFNSWVDYECKTKKLIATKLCGLNKFVLICLVFT